MYVSQDKVLSGILEYIKHEVLPEMPSYAKVLAGAALLHNSSRLNQILQDMTEGSAAKTIDLISSDGNIDVDEWCYQLKAAMNQFCEGKVEVKLPGLAPMIFRENDIDKLKNYMR